MSDVLVIPFDGWGFSENIDGRLAAPFNVSIDQSAVDIGDGILGWRGHVLGESHKYSGMTFFMSPRHTTWTETVVINVENNGARAFSGMADTNGLRCDWL